MLVVLVGVAHSDQSGLKERVEPALPRRDSGLVHEAPGWPADVGEDPLLLDLLQGVLGLHEWVPWLTRDLLEWDHRPSLAHIRFIISVVISAGMKPHGAQMTKPCGHTFVVLA